VRRLRLAGVRLARHMTQEQLAEGMDTTQSAISRLERQTDALVSTLDAYVAATGGILMVVAVYPGGDVLPLTAPPE
jgi:transcriptional regulator with XRE-family HTH domain